MKVWTVEEVVDLGSHTLGVFSLREKAEIAMNKFISDQQSKLSKSGYNFCIRTNVYFIQEFEMDAPIQ